MKYMLDTTDPRIHFLLCMHNKTSPKIRILSPQTLEVYMEGNIFSLLFLRHPSAASFDYCEREIKVGGRQVILPMLFYWYQSDFLGAGAATSISSEQDEDDLTSDGEDEGGSDDEDDGSGKGKKKNKKENPLSTIRWLTSRQASRIAKMVTEGNYQVSYEWDWTPTPSPAM